MIEGFDDVIVGSCLVALQTLLRAPLAADQNDLREWPDGAGFDSTAGLVAVDPRHHDVEQDDIRRELRENGQAFLATGRANQLVLIFEQLS